MTPTILAFVPPCIPTLAFRPPAGGAWLHEPKLDGWRMQVIRDRDRVSLYTRKGNDLAERLPALAQVCRVLPAASCILDGELVASADPSREMDLWALHRAMGQGGAHVAFVAFDLLYLDGHDLRTLPLTERKVFLRALLATATSSVVPVAEFDDGATLFEAVEGMRLEGIVSKRKDAPYRSGRSSKWLKIKSPAWVDANRERWDQLTRPKAKL